VSRRRVMILGAAGRDFHNFNVVFRDNPDHEVVCFTATQIPKISGRRYPVSLAGPQYPEGIPIFEEKDLSTSATLPVGSTPPEPTSHCSAPTRP